MYRLDMESRFQQELVNLKDSEQLWRKIISKYPDHKTRAEELLRSGVREIGPGLVVFDIILTCEALGEAELADDPDLTAEAYMRIGTLWGRKYPALSLSIWRKAEKLYSSANQKIEVEKLKPNIILSLFLAAEKFENIGETARQIKIEAKELARGLNPADANDIIDKAYLFYVKGTVLRDPLLLTQARDCYLSESMYDGVIQALDEEIRCALDAGDKEAALPLMGLIKEYGLKIGDYKFAEDVKKRIENIELLVTGPRYLPVQQQKRNVLEVLDIIACMEEGVKYTDQYKTFSKMGIPYDSSLFVLTRDGHLMPSVPTGLLFRGQSMFYDNCQASFWRKDMDDGKRLIERLKYIEFEGLTKKFLIYDIFKSGIIYDSPFGTRKIDLEVNHLGLAQHYGIKTELLDLTSDKWSAAFFACTHYDNETDAYSPVTDDKAGDLSGVIYLYQLDCQELDTKRVNTIGAQPFLRPSEQASFMKETSSDDNFNDVCLQKIRFNQSSTESCLIYHFANRANRLFPGESIQRIAHQIVTDKSSIFAGTTIQEVHSRFYNYLNDEEYLDLIKKSGVVKSDVSNVSFGPEVFSITEEGGKAFERIMKRIVIPKMFFRE